MNANTIINDEMTLEEKLAAIDTAMQEALKNATSVDSSSATSAPLDPADLLMCEGCQ